MSSANFTLLSSVCTSFGVYPLAQIAVNIWSSSECISRNNAFDKLQLSPELFFIIFETKKHPVWFRAKFSVARECCHHTATVLVAVEESEQPRENKCSTSEPWWHLSSSPRHGGTKFRRRCIQRSNLGCLAQRRWSRLVRTYRCF